jgi:chemotaxis protein MotB
MCFSWNQFCVLSVLLAALLSSGCCLHKGGDELTAAQRQARDLHVQNQQLEQMARGLTSENQALLNQLAETQSQLGTMGERLNNLASEREGLLSDRVAQTFGDSVQDQLGAGLSADGFQYDPATGLNKFRSDILFDLGSDVVRPEAGPVLKEFASSLTGGAAKGMKVLVVGHTDDQLIVRPETALKHPTNWHLSTDRADAVILELMRLGVQPERVAAMGYSEFHPLERSATDTARQRNRRVELFVVPVDQNSAKWDPVSTTSL